MTKLCMTCEYSDAGKTSIIYIFDSNKNKIITLSNVNWRTSANNKWMFCMFNNNDYKPLVIKTFDKILKSAILTDVVEK